MGWPSRRIQRPSKAAIVIANADLLRIRALRAETDDDGSYAATHCWACYAESCVERCHVIPHRLGGPNVPENYWLLCNICHNAQPDDGTLEAQLFWLFHRESQADRIWALVRPYIEKINSGELTEERARELIMGRLGP